jgi:hypothetical protein
MEKPFFDIKRPSGFVIGQFDQHMPANQYPKGHVEII